MAQLTPAQVKLMEKYGARRIQERSKFSIQIGSQGKRSTGKTHFGLKGRKPSLFVSIDMGLEDVEDRLIKLQGLKDVMVVDIVVPSFKDPKDTQKAAEDSYYVVKDAIDAACSGGFKSITIDTTTELWELFRLGYFGKTSGVPQLDYAVPNNLFSNLLRTPQTHGVDCVFIHQVENIWVTEEYTNNKGEAKTRRTETNDTKRDGFKKTDYIFRVDLEHLSRPLRSKKGAQITGLDFGIKVLRCTANPDITNLELWQSDMDGEQLSPIFVARSLVYPNSTDTDWS